MNFESLIGRINQVQDALQAQAAHAVNLSLTARNWLVGYYIVEFEQQGEDRAKYGDNLLNNIAKGLSRKGLEARRLREYRQFYRVYPQIGENVIDYLQKNAVASFNDQNILLLPTAKSKEDENQSNSIWRSASAKLQQSKNQKDMIWQTASAKLEEWCTPPDWLFNRLNYSNLSYIAGLEDPLKRAFYEQEAIRGCWSFRELDRQVSSLYYERMGLSKDKKADLIFYHRILKCHVVIDLKIDRFRHEYASQLNLYLNYYKHEVMQEDDNPPIGLLLCTDYGETTVRYATEGLSESLFVSKYRLQLPSEEEFYNYLVENISEQDYIDYKEEQKNKDI